MKVFTDSQVEDMNRRHRLLRRDLADLEAEKADLARRLRETERRLGEAQERERMASVYAGIALAAVVELTEDAE